MSSIMAIISDVSEARIRAAFKMIAEKGKTPDDAARSVSLSVSALRKRGRQLGLRWKLVAWHWIVENVDNQ